MNSGFSTNIAIFFLKVISKFPFWIIYILSDIFYIVVYYIIGYRKNVVIENLHNSFPDKNEKEIKSISKKYFHHFCDLTLEALKMGGMNEEDFRKRYRVKNPELLNKYFEKGKSVVLLTMHYNNWEWGSGFPLFLKHNVLGIYRPLNNTQFDSFMNKTRNIMGAELVQDSQTLRRVIKAEKSNEPVLVWLAGDQSPPSTQKNWYRFLNQDALFFSGPATISRKFNLPIFFQRLEKIGRGQYKNTFELLFENPNEVSEADILKAYIQKMEEVIQEEPAYYIWSHRRWKHTRPDNILLQK